MGCGKSKHAAVEHSISRKSSRAGSKRAKTPETTTGKARKLDRIASSLVAEDGGNDVCRKKPRAVADEDRVAESTELKKQENLKDDIEEKENEGGREHICDATEDVIDRKNSSPGFERGEIPKTKVEEINELDTETGSSMKDEGHSVDQSSGGDNSEGFAYGNGIIAETKEQEKSGNTLETIEETSKLDSGSSSLMEEEDKNVNQDSSSANSRAGVDETDMVESMESKESIREMSETHENTSSLMKGEGRNAYQDSNVDGNDIVETIESKKLVEKTSKTDNT
ncbi:hypothetical protein V6N13_040601 [Hibiscus sabdariffa]|uniref:Uncharacterized protein n=1 Tax=Hibiscus sabdariffa TaxID=183260 RepID=A0ABR2R8U5_9ROSI